MSCGVCESHDTSSKTRGQSQQSRSRYTSDTDESNYGDSAYTSDLPSGDECGCNDNAGDCCNRGGNGCNNGKSHSNQRASSQNWQNQQRSQQYKGSSMSESRRSSRTNENQPKRGCSCGSPSMTQERAVNGSRMYQQSITSQQSKPQSILQQPQVSQTQARGSYPPQMTSSKGQYSSQRGTVGSIGRGKLSQQLNGQYDGQPGDDGQFYYQPPESGIANEMQSQQQPVPCGAMACNQYGSQAHVNQQSPSQSSGQRGMLNNDLQQQGSQRFSMQGSNVIAGQGSGLRGSISRYQSNPTDGKAPSMSNNAMMSTSFGPTSPSGTEGQGQKQVIADCCLPNKSLMSLSDKTSQRTVVRNNSRMMSQDTGMKQESTCGCNSKVNITNNVDIVDAFVCPSCAEFDNVAEIKCCDEDGDDEPRVEPEAVPLSEPEQIDDKQKKKNGGHGFWQQMQFQIFQQQDGDDDYNANNNETSGNEDQCICDSPQDDQPAEKVKKSGNKIWQKLTLDLFQSKDDDESGSENDSSPRQGWQQQFKLQLFQEKCQGDEDEDQTDVESPAPENGLQNDQCMC